MGRTANRQMSLVGFMQAANTSVYAGSWRHPATEHGFLTANYGRTTRTRRSASPNVGATPRR